MKPRKRFPRFEAAGAPKLTLFHEDFLQWSTSERFDLVYSFGFIEHFNDWPGMIRRHAELVAEGGYLFLTTPYFRKLQYALHWLLDTPNLRQHNVHAMDHRPGAGSSRRADSRSSPAVHMGPANFGSTSTWSGRCAGWRVGRSRVSAKRSTVA